MSRKNVKSNLQPELISEQQPKAEPTLEELEEKEQYRRRLAEYLMDPAFRQIEGFPIGEDEAILALSDPPYYTACPNPFLGEIIERWQKERAELRKELGLPDDAHENGQSVYHREPFAADVSEGKNDPIYNAHSYHTKVPHKAIMRYILHYTEPGDIVLDGFCGTGMTGVASQLCGDKKTIETLGYKVQKDGAVIDEKGQVISHTGIRKSVLVDLSPAAAFIAFNYNSPVDPKAYEREARHILREVDNECGWMYETWHPHCNDHNRVLGIINYTIWSDVFLCPLCNTEMIFWDVAVSASDEKIKDNWNCPKCGATLSKNLSSAIEGSQAQRASKTVFDPDLGETIQRSLQVPVLIEYSVGSHRFTKTPDSIDLEILAKIEAEQPKKWYPNTRIDKDIDIWYERDYRQLGVYSVNGFFTNRNTKCISSIWEMASFTKNIRTRSEILFAVTGIVGNLSKMNRWPRLRGPLAGTLYIPSVNYELNPILALSRRVGLLTKLYLNKALNPCSCLISTQTATCLYQLPNSFCDYIFIDPPFGSNIIYSDLSIIWETWLKLQTNTKNEAVIHRRKKINAGTLLTYQALMEQAFAQLFFVLKPGRWLTIEFHNTQNSVWNAIQEALLRAGFMVADVRTLDKQQSSFKQVTTTAAVKQDLIISVYKPNAKFERQFLVEGGSIQGVWSFIHQHLDQIPIPTLTNGIMEVLVERQNYLLYDRMVAFHIMRGLAVPLSSPEFYQGLSQRYLERDGMYLTSAQATIYDRLRLEAEKVEQLSLFVTDERSAVQWLRQAMDLSLGGEPQTYQDLQPKFIQQLHQARHEKLPELLKMLEENFLQDVAGRWYNPDPDRQADIAALRQKTLMREYKEYLKGKGRLKVFRSEAVRAGFSADWKERNYEDIVKVAERLPENVLQDDQGLLMYYHNASLRLSEKPKQEKLF